MNIIDENIIDNQCQLLRKWRIPFRQIGYGVGRQGMQDMEIISLLHGLRNPTFFTRDDDFYDRNLCHSGYCLVYLGIRKDEAAIFLRRFIRHKKFDTLSKRMVSIIRVSHSGLSVWHIYEEKQTCLSWTN